MYSRSQTGRGSGIRLPERYSGVAFDRAHPDAPPALAAAPEPRQVEYCADGLPVPHHAPTPEPEAPPEHCTAEKEPSPIESSIGEGLLGAIGGEELLLLGIIFLLAQRQGEDDTILLLLLLLLRR